MRMHNVTTTIICVLEIKTYGHFNQMPNLNCRHNIYLKGKREQYKHKLNDMHTQCIYIYIYIYVLPNVYIYIYIYICITQWFNGLYCVVEYVHSYIA